MSIKIMSKVWELSELSGGDLLVLLAIADFANDKGIAWPSVETLSKKARLSERQTQYVVQRLEKLKFLEIGDNEGPKGVNTYRVMPEGANSSPGGVQLLHPGGAAHCTGGVQPTAPRTVIEPSVPISKEIGGTRFAPPSLEEVKLNGAKIGLPDNECQKFFHYHMSKGWRIGRNPMKSWTAAMLYWRTKWIESGSPICSSKPEQRTWAQREIDRICKPYGC